MRCGNPRETSINSHRFACFISLDREANPSSFGQWEVSRFLVSFLHLISREPGTLRVLGKEKLPADRRFDHTKFKNADCTDHRCMCMRSASELCRLRSREKSSLPVGGHERGR